MTSNNTLTRRAGGLATLMVLSASLVAGCETTTHGQQGQVLGGVLGGVLGAQVGDGDGRTAAIILGTLAGSSIGKHIGETMDDTDRMMATQSLRDNRTGESSSWVNPDTGYRYTFTPTRTHQHATGPCREFSLDATIGNQSDQEVYGTACLQADGSWLIH